MARLTLDPKAVLTARVESPMSLKSLEKECARAKRGRSSAITTQLLTHDRFTPRACSQTKSRKAYQEYKEAQPNACNNQSRSVWS